ncbi:MAG: hypothetical protein RIQ88_27 [Actinomycetota bacterium]|jgi:ATP-binding protein involved in chromosome partitioning
MNELETKVYSALGKLIDPELGKPITELGMVGAISGDLKQLVVEIKLTVVHCPQADYIEQSAKALLEEVFPQVTIQMSVMSKAELDSLKILLRGKQKSNPFTANSATRVILVTSGKGGVGKSTIASNLAVGLAKNGNKVGLIDADIFGFSILSQMGVTARPTRLDDMMLPPESHGVKVISIGMFFEGNEAISWRGPMLHKAIEQFLVDVHWGELDYLVIDLPPGTGDVSISLGQLLPHAKVLVVTTPQPAAAEVAIRSGLAAIKANQEIMGVVENMSWLENGITRELIFGSGGAAKVAEQLTSAAGYPVEVLVQIPLNQSLAESSDQGMPLILKDFEDNASKELQKLVRTVAAVKLGKAARTLTVKLGQ